MKYEKKQKLSYIADLIQAKLVGNPDFEISGMNEIHVVKEGDITFVDHPKYYEKALTSKASVILINQEVECPTGKCLLVHPDPFNAFNQLTLHFRPFTYSSIAISLSAEIGKDTIIQPNVFVGNRVKIGKNCVIHANVSIYDDTIIGDNVIIQANSVIGGDACYFQKKDGEFRKFSSCGRTIIEDNVEIGALCAIDRGVSADTIIGKGTKMDNFVQVGHDTIIGKNCLVGSHTAIAGVSIIEDDVLIWAQASINKDIVIGKGAIILATSAVDKSIEGNGKIYFGQPAIEASKKWRELAALRRLPELINDVNTLMKEKQ